MSSLPHLVPTAKLWELHSSPRLSHLYKSIGCKLDAICQTLQKPAAGSTVFTYGDHNTASSRERQLALRRLFAALVAKFLGRCSTSNLAEALLIPEQYLSNLVVCSVWQVHLANKTRYLPEPKREIFESSIQPALAYKDMSNCESSAHTQSSETLSKKFVRMHVGL